MLNRVALSHLLKGGAVTRPLCQGQAQGQGGGAAAVESYLTTEWIDPVTSSKGWLAIDGLVDGLCGGGTRMAPGVTRQEVQRLARTMSKKLAVTGWKGGGAKCAIDFDPEDPEARGVLKRFYEAHLPFLKHTYATAQDMGTSETQIIDVLDEIESGLTPLAALLSQESGQERVDAMMGLIGKTMDGWPVSEVITGFGCAEATCEVLALKGLGPQCSVAVQGFGEVGCTTAFYLDRLGHKITTVADMHGSMTCDNGLDIEILLAAACKGVIDRSNIPAEYALGPKEAWLSSPVDVLVPAACSDQITADNVGEISARCKLIVEGANLPTTPAAQARLHAMGVFVIPDYFANAGGVSSYAAVQFHGVAPDTTDVAAWVGSRIRSMCKRLHYGSNEQPEKLPRAISDDIAAGIMLEWQQQSRAK
jgi:glutamate dehydrogenase (NAD(P)+)